jgi:hypothetical protein
MGSIGGARTGATEEPNVTELLDHILDGVEMGALPTRSIHELRELRDRCQSIESGLSYGRRMIQGRLDIVICEVERRSSGGPESLDELMARLPAVLSRQTRGNGAPRPVRDAELPTFTNDLTGEADAILDPTELGHLADASNLRIDEIIVQLQALESQVSAKRHETHRRIDELQDEIVSRYRSGAASVDELLR